MSRNAIHEAIRKLTEAHLAAIRTVLDELSHDDLDRSVPDAGFTVKDKLRGWSHELSSHYRELIITRGRLRNDNPSWHVPHLVREASEQFGRFIGELACFTDDQLNDKFAEDGRSVADIAQHLTDTIGSHIPSQIQARDRD